MHIADGVSVTNVAEADLLQEGLAEYEVVWQLQSCLRRDSAFQILSSWLGSISAIFNWTSYFDGEVLSIL